MKYIIDGSIGVDKFKLMAKRCTQIKEINYLEIFIYTNKNEKNHNFVSIGSYLSWHTTS